MNKKTMIAAVALVAVVALLLGIWWIFRPTPKPVDKDLTAKESVLGRKTITIQVVHGDGSKKNVTLLTNSDYLGEVLFAEGLIENDGADDGMFNIVDGEKADWNENKSYWALYVGDDYAMQGVNDTPINDGDSFKLVYTIG